jgi:glycosyltransferase involved in cell wall biosynthesis
MKKLISIVTPTFNEEENILKICNDIKKVFLNLNYSYEHIVIDNNSTDKTQNILIDTANNDKNLKLIFNEKNFGHLKSPYYGILQSSGDAVILINGDGQDPVELIPKLLEKWENNKKVVLFKKNSSNENYFLHNSKILFYKLLNKISDVNLIENATGSGLYDKSIVKNLKKINEPYPFLRGIFLEFTDNCDYVLFDQKKRNKGISKNNLFTLYDNALLGIVKHSKILVRMLTIIGMISFFISSLIFIVYLFINLFSLIDISFTKIFLNYYFSILLNIIIFGLGIVGEYLILIFIHTRNLPLIIEKRRINFN